MGFGFSSKTYNRETLSDGNVELVEKAVLKKAEDMKAFGSISANDGMVEHAKNLEKELSHWIAGIENRIPEEFEKLL